MSKESLDADTYFAMEDIHHEIEEMAYQELRRNLSQLTTIDSEQSMRVEKVRKEIHDRAKEIVFDRLQKRNIDLEKAALYCICKDREWGGPYSYRDPLLNVDDVIQSVVTTGIDDGSTQGAVSGDAGDRVESETKSDDNIKGSSFTGSDKYNADIGMQDKNYDSLYQDRGEDFSEDEDLSVINLEHDGKDYKGLSYASRKQIGYTYNLGKPSDATHVKNEGGSHIEKVVNKDAFDKQQLSDQGFEAQGYNELLHSSIYHLDDYYVYEEEEITEDQLRKGKYISSGYRQVISGERYRDMESKLKSLQEFEMQEGYDITDFRIDKELQDRKRPEEWIRKMIDGLIDFLLLVLTSDSLGYSEEISKDMISEMVHLGEKSIGRESASLTYTSSMTTVSSDTYESLFSTGDLEYLHDSFGNSLILAMASTTMTQPTAPLAYFAQFLLMLKYVPDFAKLKKEYLKEIQKMKEKSKAVYTRILKQHNSIRLRPNAMLNKMEDTYEFHKIGKVILGRGKRLKKDIVTLCNNMIVESPLHKVIRKIKKEQLHKHVLESFINLSERLNIEVDLVKQEEKAILYDDLMSLLKRFFPELKTRKRPNIFMRYLSIFARALSGLSYEGPLSTPIAVTTKRLSRLKPTEITRFEVDQADIRDIDADEIIRLKLIKNIKDVLTKALKQKSILETTQQEPIVEDEEYPNLHDTNIIYPTYPCKHSAGIQCNVTDKSARHTTEHAVLDVFKVINESLNMDRGQQTDDPYTLFRVDGPLPNMFEEYKEKMNLTKILHISKNDACALCKKIKVIIRKKKDMANNIRAYQAEFVVDFAASSMSVIVDQKFNARFQEKFDDKLMILNSVQRIINSKLEFESEIDRQSIKDKFILYISRIIEKQKRETIQLKYSEKLRLNSEIDNLFYELFYGDEIDYDDSEGVCECTLHGLYSVPYAGNEDKSQNISTQIVLEDIIQMISDSVNQLNINIKNLDRIQQIVESFITRASRTKPYISEYANKSFRELSSLVINLYFKDEQSNRAPCVCKAILFISSSLTEVFDRIEKVFEALYHQQKQSLELEIMKMFAAAVNGLNMRKLQAQVIC